MYTRILITVVAVVAVLSVGTLTYRSVAASPTPGEILAVSDFRTVTFHSTFRGTTPTVNEVSAGELVEVILDGRLPRLGQTTMSMVVEYVGDGRFKEFEDGETCDGAGFGVCLTAEDGSTWTYDPILWGWSGEIGESTTTRWRTNNRGAGPIEQHPPVDHGSLGLASMSGLIFHQPIVDGVVQQDMGAIILLDMDGFFAFTRHR